MEDILRNFTMLFSSKYINYSKREKGNGKDICGERKPYADFSK